MQSSELRKKFIGYFERKQHRHLPSASLVPDNDSSVLLTTAGMQQFKPFYLGEKDPQREFGTTRVVTIQKSFRTSDIEKVGDESHLTFFEMLGNFSFADYGKKEAITWAWEFLSKVMKLPATRLWATVFAGDDEVPGDAAANQEWRKHMPAARIVALGRDGNFWGPTGTSGPCGPCTEIHWQLDPTKTGGPENNPDNFLEIWNLVFTEYNQDSDGKLKKLKHLHIDTGMGFERLAMVTQKKTSIFETDLFRPLTHLIRDLPGFEATVEAGLDARRQRIVADHFRAACFLLADGVVFSNKDQGYILRRLVRRAADQFIKPDFTYQPLVREIIGLYGGLYPELKSREKIIYRALEQELVQYAKILQIDVQAVLRKIRKTPAAESAAGASHIQLTPTEAFALYATHGLSLDRLQRLGFVFDRTAVTAEIEKHQELSRAGAAGKFGGHGLDDPELNKKYDSEQIKNMTRMHTATHLLQAALRRVLGDGVTQAGSDITPERLRFDFTFDRKLTADETKTVERLVNDQIVADQPVTCEVMPYQQAVDRGAVAFFKEKYGAEVKVYSIGNFSKELCAGPHIGHTAEIGSFKITAAQSIGANTKRIKAVVG